MPRSRRRHHSRSRSRSRSHSHERDREPKRRRVESPDSSHHRRSVSVDSEPTSQKTIDPVPDLNSTVESTKEDDLNTTVESTDIITDTTNKHLNTTLELDSTPKKVLSPAQRKKHDEKMKLKQEREEQRLKERKEKEDQRRKEREERELQKRKEREEKEEQKRKEREEKEEQKRKEREEKEEQKRKEREEKEEQKRKEREEKEEQKLKKQQEIDEKNRDKKKKEELMQKEKAAFVNFFVPRKSSGAPEVKKAEEENKSYAFMPFEVKSDMRVAPVIRISISNEQKDELVEKLQTQCDGTYLDEIKRGKKIGRCARTWPVEDDDSVIVLEETDLGECLDEEKPKVEKMRAKLLKFHENRRPAYFGTWRKKSKTIQPRKPLGKDTEFFDYDVDSDDDWEEEEPGEDIAGSDDDEKETEADDYEVDNEFFVPHGYLSDEEGQDENENEKGDGDGEMETKLKLLQEEFDKEMNSKTERIKPRLIGCIWENKLIPKVQDAIHQFLDDRMMIVCGTIQIQKRDLFSSTNMKFSTAKSSTPGRKQLSQELIPDFVQLIHGNTNNQNILVNEFISYLATKESDKPVSKASLFANLKRLAKWRKCPDDGAMHKKFCWYVEEDVRNRFHLKLELPNKWTYVGSNPDEINNSKKKLIV